MAPVLVTGAAGFIGYHLAERLLAQGRQVVGIDSLDPYYSVDLKKARLQRLQANSGFEFTLGDIAEADDLNALFEQHRFKLVYNMAAQAGVRYSIENPQAYVRANVVGFVNLLECCRHYSVENLIYASSSSVYGAGTQLPFSTHQSVDHPLSVYAATKKSNEMLAHSYSHLHRLPATGVRFFTVYGPWGRPDMAMFLFAKAILAGEPINVFNHGKMQRDFTYIDDVVEALTRLADRPAAPNPNWSGTAPDLASSTAPHRLYNVGNHNPVELMRLIEVLEQTLGRKAETNFLPMQPGDVPATYADIDDLAHDVGFAPSTSIETGVANFVAWYRDYFKV
jgi:UDP-glucuronate 4-epimerase